MVLQRIDAEVEFITPAFLGNAWQKGQWRVPPFKALLRRWWRILEAPNVNYDWHELRRREGLLWGNAFLGRDDLPEGIRQGHKNGHRCSLIEIRLSEWKCGNITEEQWRGVDFGKIKPGKNAKFPIDVDLYLGFGAVQPLNKERKEKEGKSKELANPPAINKAGSAVLRLLIRDSQYTDICHNTLSIIHMFGAIGSRSNNGWGSLSINNVSGKAPEPPARNWMQYLELDWPHAFGKDNAGKLIWQSERVFSRPEEALKQIAHLKAAIRDEAKALPRNRQANITPLFLLGYPVQGPHDLGNKFKEQRWPSQIRFKVIRSDGGYRCLVYHLPHRPPPPIWSRLSSAQQQWVEEVQVELWDKVHACLDDMCERWRG